ncbi:hypothetical protein SBRY_20134 [Actinacidiphila bryophytorum]|uniref:Uncharacterized protein n=1 Tax=Actinacidiphila bryophytorum TaxID=1436133 RepID=A0A9W4E3D8_9ACTN|nr:hypothetical protein SBRY_20134 [Actinacidiphila bryophytorum]
MGRLGDLRDHHQRGRHLQDPVRPPVDRCAGHLEPDQPGPEHRAARDGLGLRQRPGCRGGLRQDAVLLRRQVRQHGGEDHRQGAARRHVGQLPGPAGHRHPGDQDRLQPVRRPGVRAVHILRHDAQRRQDQLQLDLHRAAVLLQERPQLVQGAGLPRRWERAELHLPPLLGAGRHRDGDGSLRSALRRVMR